jgi:enamine deaminase RidA (YjgF/YER057c/UK114 family)
MNTIDAALKELGLAWPTSGEFEAEYSQVIQDGNLLYVSGQIPEFNGSLTHVGKVGGTLSISEGADAASYCALNLLHQVRLHLGGNLDRLQAVTAMKVYVNAEGGFTKISDVADGASRFLKTVLGTVGNHSRTTVGVNTLYENVPVEIDAVVSLRA